MIARVFALAAGGAGAICLSQAPEFAQHYQQRIGGAVDELTIVVEDFDDDARRSELERSQALAKMTLDEDQLVRDRAASMEKTIRRLDNLEIQQFELNASPTVVKPLIVAVSPDPQVAEGAWEDFAPALPITSGGLIYAAIGFLIGLLVAWPIIAVMRGLFFRRHRKQRA